MRQSFVFIFAVLSMLVAFTANAKPPADVMEAYRAYRVAVEQDDTEAAQSWARKAYDRGRKALESDDPLLGNLAHILAGLSSDRDERVDLYRASLKASPTDTPEAVLMAAERHVALGQAQSLRQAFMTRRQFSQARRDIEAGWDFMQAHDLNDQTFGAEMMVLMGWITAVEGDTEEALDWYDKAQTVFESPAHRYFSLLAFSNKLLKGKTLAGADRDIEAALVFQEVMQNVEGKLPSDHPYVDSAFRSWLEVRNEIQEAGLMVEAENAGVCKCWPYDEMSANAPLPLDRAQPVIPRKALREGESGKAIIRFDVTKQGRTENIQVVGYTNRMFVRPSIKAAESWIYEVGDELEPSDRRGLTTTLTYEVFNTGTGKTAPSQAITMVDRPG